MNLTEYLGIDKDCKYYAKSLSLKGTQVTEIPDNFTIDGYLDLDKSLVENVPKGLICEGLYLDDSPVRTISDNVTCEELYLNRSIVKIVPDNLKCEDIYLTDSIVENYPVVHNCGNNNRSIYLDYNDRSVIHIGCFVGNKHEAIERIKANYKDPEEYIKDVERCFELDKEFPKI